MITGVSVYSFETTILCQIEIAHRTIASMASLLCSPQILVGWQLGQFSGWKGCVTQILSLAGNAPK